jgi:hypothetical protein
VRRLSLLRVHSTAELTGIRYSGLDVSPSFLELLRRKFPEVTYYQVDLLEDDAALPVFDVMNGIFTSRAGLSDEQMSDYMCRLLRRVASGTNVGLAFNAMSTHVDSLRVDLFHCSVDRVLGFLSREISRHLVVRHDLFLLKTPSWLERLMLLPAVGTLLADDVRLRCCPSDPPRPCSITRRPPARGARVASPVAGARAVPSSAPAPHSGGPPAVGLGLAGLERLVQRLINLYRTYYNDVSYCPTSRCG